MLLRIEFNLSSDLLTRLEIDLFTVYFPQFIVSNLNVFYLTSEFRGCINGVCTAPNRCSCREGWTVDKTGTKCDPKCDRPCINGNYLSVK